VVNYRPFRNSDPPAVRRLWDECGLGRGAATGLDADILETVVFSQPYFDPAGLILAEVDGQTVGAVHAGFGPSADRTALDCRTGVICAVLVAPAHRRQGIGRELVRQAEKYLRARGAETILAGGADPFDPFYVGIYGGSQPAGFLESDPLAAPFFTGIGYAADARHVVYQRSLAEKSDPIGLRLMGLRRTTRLAPFESQDPRDWWWQTRAGRLDSVELALVPKAGGQPLASVTVVGLDFYLPRWQQRAIGLLDLQVPESQRRKGHGQALLVEVCRRVRDEMITLAEAHVPEGDAAARRVFESAGFKPVDAGVVYRLPASA
jgi:ribosomal protein S18 acetylase RimI-like enzyme